MASNPSFFNSLALVKGKTSGKYLAAWDAVGQCHRNECVLHMDCPYLVGMSITNSSDDRCKLQTNYLQYIYDMIIIKNVDGLTQNQIDQIGMHLIPLYGHLIKFKMIEFTITAVNDIVQIGRSGKSIHPIFSAIRETLKAINMAWFQIGLSQLGIRRPNNPDKSELERMMENGDPNYTDSLVSGDFGPGNHPEKKTRVIRRK